MATKISQVHLLTVSLFLLLITSPCENTTPPPLPPLGPPPPLLPPFAPPPLDPTKSYNNKSNIKMVDNFVAHLFPQIEVRKHGTLIDEIEFAGIASTVKGSVSHPGLNEFNGNVVNSVFKTFPHESRSFAVVGNLGDRGLGLFNDICLPKYEGGFEITFIRNNGNNATFGWKVLNFLALKILNYLYLSKEKRP